MLLNLRFCDLGLRLPRAPDIARIISQLNDELDQKGIVFRPHYWLSHEWFVEDYIPGIAIPFYLAHPRLKALEKKMMLEVEGGTQRWCMQILRHELAIVLRGNARVGLRQHHFDQIHG